MLNFLKTTVNIEVLASYVYVLQIVAGLQNFSRTENRLKLFLCPSLAETFIKFYLILVSSMRSQYCN